MHMFHQHWRENLSKKFFKHSLMSSYCAFIAYVLFSLIFQATRPELNIFSRFVENQNALGYFRRFVNYPDLIGSGLFLLCVCLFAGFFATAVSVMAKGHFDRSVKIYVENQKDA